MSKRKYSTTSLHPEARLVIGCLYAAVEQTDISLKQFRHLLQEAGFDIPRSTLNRYKSAAQAGGHVLKRVKLSGGSPKLKPQEKDILVGMIVYKNLHNERVVLKTIQEFANKYFQQTLSPSFVSVFLASNNFTRKTVQRKARGFRLNFKEAATSYFDWILNVKTPALSGRELHAIGSIDFTYTRHGNTTLSSFSPKGGYVRSFIWFPSAACF